jgi:hypothetical protein
VVYRGHTKRPWLDVAVTRGDPAARDCDVVRCRRRLRVDAALGHVSSWAGIRLQGALNPRSSLLRPEVQTPGTNTETWRPMGRRAGAKKCRRLDRLLSSK